MTSLTTRKDQKPLHHSIFLIRSSEHYVIRFGRHILLLMNGSVAYAPCNYFFLIKKEILLREYGVQVMIQDLGPVFNLPSDHLKREKRIYRNKS